MFPKYYSVVSCDREETICCELFPLLNVAEKISQNGDKNCLKNPVYNYAVARNIALGVAQNVQNKLAVKLRMWLRISLIALYAIQ